jgi:lipopolysaccharide transport system permease protein
MLLNPITPVVVTGRDWLTGSGEGMPGAFAAVFAAAIVVLIIGILFYKVALPHLVERLSG